MPAEFTEHTAAMIAIASDLGMDEIIRRAPVMIKVAQPRVISELAHRAIPGVTLRHMPNPPAELEMLNHAGLTDAEYCYFSLNQAGVMWDGIRKSGEIALYVPSEFEHFRAELVTVVTEESESGTRLETL